MLTKLKLSAGLAAAALSLAASGAGAATLVPIVNGSFEAGTTGAAKGLSKHLTFGQLNTTGAGWDVYTGVQGWTTSAGGRLEVHADRDPTKIDAQDGDYFISLDGGKNSNSGISQDVALSKGSYILSFWFSPESTNVASNAIAYSVGTLVSGVAKWGVNGAKLGKWTQISVLFRVKGAGGLYNLGFAAQGTANGVGGLLDNVQIAAVPVPAAGAGLLAGLGALGAMRRRKRA